MFRVERRLRSGKYRTLAGKLTDEGGLGVNSFVWNGRLKGRALAPGRYRLRAVATDEAGIASKPRRISFRIVRR